MTAPWIEQRRRWQHDRDVREAKIMRVIRERLREHKRPPTMREIAVFAGISSTSVVRGDLGRLEGQGLIRLRSDGGTRGIELVVGPDDPCPFCGGKPCDR